MKICHVRFMFVSKLSQSNKLVLKRKGNIVVENVLCSTHFKLYVSICWKIDFMQIVNLLLFCNVMFVYLSEFLALEWIISPF